MHKANEGESTLEAIGLEDLNAVNGLSIRLAVVLHDKADSIALLTEPPRNMPLLYLGTPNVPHIIPSRKNTVRLRCHEAD